MRRLVHIAVFLLAVLPSAWAQGANPPEGRSVSIGTCLERFTESGTSLTGVGQVLVIEGYENSFVWAVETGCALSGERKLLNMSFRFGYGIPVRRGRLTLMMRSGILCIPGMCNGSWSGVGVGLDVPLFWRIGLFVEGWKDYNLISLIGSSGCDSLCGVMGIKVDI